jgi:hypothetical protein
VRVRAAHCVPLPNADGRGIKAESPGERLLGESFSLPRGPHSSAEGQGFGPWVVSEESEDAGEEVDLRRSMALLPIREARLRAADLAGHRPLWEAAVEAHAPQVVAQGLRALGVARRSTSVFWSHQSAQFLA